MADKTKLQEYRDKYPQYQDLSDADLAKGIKAKFYPDMTEDEFNQKIGLVSQQIAAEPSIGKRFARQAELGSRSVLEGLATIPNMIGDAANTTINMGIRGANAVIDEFRPQSLNDVIAGEREPVIPYLMKPSDATKAFFDQAGAKPETPGERVSNEAIKWLSTLPVSAGAGELAAKYGSRAVKSLSQLADNMASQGAGAVTGGLSFGTARELYPDSPGVQLAAGLLGSMGGSGAMQMAMNRTPAQVIPETGELRSMAQAAYQQADDAGAIIKPEAIQRLAANVTDDLAEAGYHPNLQPRIATVLSELERVGKENITTKGVQTLRRIAGNAAQSPDPSERMLGSRIISQIDDMLATLTPDDVVQGNADEAADALKRASQLWSQFRKSEMVDDAVERGVNRAASTGSGGNEENAIRQNIRAILDSSTKRRGFNAEEISAMEKVVKGGAIQNMFRLVGKLSPSGNGLMAALGLGAVSTGTPLGIAPVAGLVAKPIAEQMARRNVGLLSEAIRSRGLLPQPQQAGPGILPGLLPFLYQSGQ